MTLSRCLHPDAARRFPPEVAPTTQEIDAILESGRDAWHIPGMAAVVVQNGKIVYLKGLGVKRLGGSEPLTPDTVFPLASCTKPFTALALARLVDDGTIGWDDLVHKHLPDLHLKDPCADERMTLRDLLCHRTGMGRHDPLWYRSPWTASERLSKLVLLDPESDFRTRFEYQPVLFAQRPESPGRRACERPRGKSWDGTARPR